MRKKQLQDPVPIAKQLRESLTETIRLSKVLIDLGWTIDCVDTYARQNVSLDEIEIISVHREMTRKEEI